MIERGLGLEALAWLLTYGLHSTLLLLAAWYLTSRQGLCSERAKESVWKTALVGGLLTTTLQVAGGMGPEFGRMTLREEAGEQVATAAEKLRTVPGKPSSQDSRAVAGGSELRNSASSSQNKQRLQQKDLRRERGRVSDSRERSDQAPRTSSSKAQRSPRHADTDGPLATKETQQRTSADAQVHPEIAVLSGSLDREASAPAIHKLVNEAQVALRSHWMDVLLSAWVAGGCLLIGLLFLAGARLRDRLAGRRIIVEGPLPALLEDLRKASGLRRRVRLLVSPKLNTPVALGTLFPQVVLPPKALEELPRDQQSAMLAHELGHISRLDPLWLCLSRWIEILLFFQPLNRLASRRLRESSEYLCDAWAVEHTGDRISLALCLTTVAGWLVSERNAIHACGMAELRSPLGARVERILNRDPKAMRHEPRWLIPVGTGLLTGTVLLAPSFSSPGIAPASEVRTVDSIELAEQPRDMPDIPARARRSRAIQPTTPARSVHAELQTLQDSIHSRWMLIEDELQALRAGLASSGKQKAGLSKRLVIIEEHAAQLALKKARIDSILDRWIEPRSNIATPVPTNGTTTTGRRTTR